MRLITLLKWARRLLPLISFPNWQNAEDTREWALKAADVADEIAAETETEVDDVAVEAVREFLLDATTWNSLHALILGLLTDGAGDVQESDERVLSLADEVKVDPAVIILIIQAVMELISWWRNRNYDARLAS